jgi:catechol 2,3-dioxygenase-like lactoylglutathione lyase family enzyme
MRTRCSGPLTLQKEIVMLGDKDAAANLAVKDLQVARKFYEGTLGLEKVDAEGDELVVYKSGESTLNVYRSDYAGTNRATAVTWTVGNDIERVVRDLKAKGVTFEHYDMPDMKLEGDVHVAADMKVAWFKDPDGNILNLASR